LKVLFISDTHLRHNQGVLRHLEDWDADILCHSGDALMCGGIDELLTFRDWFGRLKFKHKIFVPGNHDRYFEQHFDTARVMVEEMSDKGRIKVLCDSGTEIEGLRFYGSPHTNMFYNWAYMLDTEEELARKFRGIPEGLDVLLTHGPPKTFSM
jgi:predicted phosphodiesterase